MKTFRIENKHSAVILGEYEAADEQSALDAMAQDAGYDSYQEYVDSIDGLARDELIITTLEKS